MAIDAVTNKERKKITKMVKEMDSASQRSLLSAKENFVISTLLIGFSNLVAINGYVSAFDDDYEGFLQDDGVVSFAWPLKMRVFDNGFGYPVPDSWRNISKKKNLFKWAYNKVYHDVNTIFLRRMPTAASDARLKTVFTMREKMLSEHGWKYVQADFKGDPIVIIYRNSQAGNGSQEEKTE